MNKNKIKGVLKEQAGKLMEDEALQTEGKVQYFSGMLLEYYGKKKEKVFKTINGMIDSLSQKKVVVPVPAETKV